MFRRLLATVLIAGSAAFVAPVGVAGAATFAIPLTIPQAEAVGLLGHACSPPQESVTAEGFDPVTGFPTANVYILTACSGSGRGGGGSHSYTVTVGAIFDDAGAVFAIVPTFSTPGAGPGFTAYDTLGNEEFQSGSSALLQWAPGFVPIPRVTGLSVTAGSTAGGQTETVSGSGFTNATTVDVGSVPVPFTVVNDTTLTLTTPPDAVTSATAVDVTVTSSEGTSTTSPADQFTYTLPTVTGLSVTDGPATGGTAVTLTGVGFLGATAVDFGTLPAASFSVVSDTSISVTAPADTAITDDATVDVSVVSPNGSGATSTADQFTYAVAPRITSITPSSGPLIGGTDITIAGADLAFATQLVIGEAPVSFSYNPDGTISAQTPSGDAYQAVPVVLTTVGGSNVGGGAARFTYAQGTPQVTIFPDTGPVGTLISVSGYSFVPGEKLTVTYATGLPGHPKITLCKTVAAIDGSYGCAGTPPAKYAGPAGDHSVTVTGRHGKVVDSAVGIFTLT